MADENLIINLDLSIKDVQEKLSQLEGKVNSTGDKIGSSVSNRISGGFGKAFLKIGASVAAIGATIAGALISKKSIDAAIVQENAINRLNASLRSVGQFTQVTSSELQNFASEMQKTTVIGDEVAMSLISLSLSMGSTVKQSKEITKSAADLSYALGIDAQTAVRGLSQTLSGQAGVLARYIPELRTLTEEQLKNGGAIDLVRERFNGFAEAQRNTFSGAMQASSNAFGDLLEVIGDVMVKSPTMIAIVGKLTTAFEWLGEKLKSALGDTDWINVLLSGLTKINSFLISYILPIAELVYNAFNTIFNALRTGHEALIFGILKGTSFLTGALAKVGIGKELNASIQEATEKSRETLGGFAQDTKNSFDNLFTFDATLAAEKFNQNLIEFTEQIKPVVQEQTDQIKQAMLGDGSGGGFFENMAAMVNSMTVGFSSGVTVMAETAKAAAGIIKNSFANVISGSIQTVIKSIMAGKGAFEGLVGFILGAFGDMAMQLGQMFILKGLAIDATKSLVGGQAIAAGIALVALGQVMKSYSGSLGGGADMSGGGGGVAGGFSSSSDTAEITGQQQEERVVDTQITVNVQGDILDSNESGSRIVDMINSAFDKQGVRIQRGVLA